MSRVGFQEPVCAFHVFLVSCVLLQITCIHSEEPPEILTNGTFLDIEEDDIAHFTCMASGIPRPAISWEKTGTVLKDKDEGIAILLSGNGSVGESHLFIAVTDDERRGNYTCVVSNERGVKRETFVLKDGPSKLSSTDLTAIGVSVGLGVFLLSAIIFLLWRANRKIEQSRRNSRRRTTLSEASAHENNVFALDDTKNEQRSTLNESRDSMTFLSSL